MLYTFLYMACKNAHWYVYAYKCALVFVACCLLVCAGLCSGVGRSVSLYGAKCE